MVVRMALQTWNRVYMVEELHLQPPGYPYAWGAAVFDQRKRQKSLEKEATV